MMLAAKILKDLGFVEEYAFASGRRWRFDFAHVEQKVAIEVEGGLWKWGRHNRPQGYIKDTEKYNEAALLGWRVLRYDTERFSRLVFLRDLARLGFPVAALLEGSHHCD